MDDIRNSFHKVRHRGDNAFGKTILVQPDYAYPNTRMTHEELDKEVEKPSSYYHDLRVPARRGEEIGLLHMEVLQCFGLPKLDQFGETDAYCLAVCGSYAFRTDIIPDVPNPMWLPKMRRACIFPLYVGYSRLYVGVFDDDGDIERDDFAGRVVIDIARLRPNSTYTFTLPLRQSAHVYMKRPRGAIRLRIHITWKNERAMIMSYLPINGTQLGRPRNDVTVRCCGKNAFQNVAMAVHGSHPPGRFALKQVKAMVREINFVQVHILRYIRKKETISLITWEYPIISGFVFIAWMHSIYKNTICYVPGHIITFLLLHIWKNYAYYGTDGPKQQGMIPPSWEELFMALIRRDNSNNNNHGKNNIQPKPAIQPLELTATQTRCPYELIDPTAHNNTLACSIQSLLDETTKAFQSGVRVKRRRNRLVFTGTDAVDFLVNNGFAKSRLEAVQLGRQLSEVNKVFVHVSGNTKQQFEDDSTLHYHFLSENERPGSYVTKTHRPLGKFWFRLFGFYGKNGENNRTFAYDQMEMPYGPGSDYPRITMKESLVLRRKESKKQKRIIKKLPTTPSSKDDDDSVNLILDDDDDNNSNNNIPVNNTNNNNNDLDASSTHSTGSIGSHSMSSRESNNDDIISSDGSIGEDFISTSFRPNTDNNDDHSIDSETVNESNKNLTYTVILPKPPPQDIDIKTKADKPINEILDEVKGDVHKYLLHAFHESTFVVKRPLKNLTSTNSSSITGKESAISKMIMKRVLTKKSGGKDKDGNNNTVDPTTNSAFDLTNTNNNSVIQKKNNKKNSSVEATKDEYDKILKTGVHSSSNMWMNKIAAIVLPMIEMAMAFLSLFRAIYNAFTWQDPILSFWITIFGPIIVIILHIMPWRIILGIVGIGAVGPQNYILRLIRERKGIPPPNMDTIIKRKKIRKDDDNDTNQPLFSMKFTRNEPINYSTLKSEEPKHIVVPSTPLMYNHRFYDWPPQPEYARVTPEPPPVTTYNNNNYIGLPGDDSGKDTITSTSTLAVGHDDTSEVFVDSHQEHITEPTNNMKKKIRGAGLLAKVAFSRKKEKAT